MMQSLLRRLISLAKDRGGATGIYVALAMPVLLGVGALSIDLGRVMILHTELQNAADAAALAAARELDRMADSQDRATLAASNFIKNSQNFSAVAGDVTITGVTFYSSLNPLTTATSSLNSHFVKVDTQLYSATNTFIRVVGGPEVSNANASAVAGNHQTACQVAPLMMCNPSDPSYFDLKRGQMMRLTHNKWGPGAFGLLDPPNAVNSGADDTMKLLGGNGMNGCFYTSGVSLNTGKDTGKIDQGFNIRFDMYPPGANTTKMDGALPAPVVIKGQSFAMNGGNCEFTPNTPPFKAMPRDHCVREGDGTNCAKGDYLGSDDWHDEADAYWAANHPGKTVKPKNAAGTAYGSKGFTRYDLYLWESEPANRPDGAENPDPVCSKEQKIEDVGDTNRRVLYVAVINCSQYDISGNATPNMVPLSYARFFLTEPAAGGEIFAEFIDIATPENSNGVVHDIIQLYR